MSDEAINVEPLAVTPIFIEGGMQVIALNSSPGPFGPISLAVTTMAIICDGGGTPIIPGFKADLPAPFTGRVTGWELLGDLAGNAVVDILVGQPLTGGPFVSITAGNKPHLTAVDAAAGDALGWTPELSPDDVVRYVVQSADTVRKLTIALFVERD